MARNKIEDLRNHLFEAIEMLKDGEIEIDKAKAIADISQTIINSAKVEVDFIKTTGSTRDTGFLQIGEPNDE